MKKHLTIYLFTAFILCLSTEVNAQQVVKGFEFKTKKVSKDSIAKATTKKGLGKASSRAKKALEDSTANFEGLVIRVPKDQFIRPKYVLLSLKQPSGKEVFTSTVEPDWLSGAQTDSTGRFTQDKDDFIFRIQGVRPKKYKVILQVFQEDGTVYYIKEDDMDLWEKGSGE